MVNTRPFILRTSTNQLIRFIVFLFTLTLFIKLEFSSVFLVSPQNAWFNYLNVMNQRVRYPKLALGAGEKEV